MTERIGHQSNGTAGTAGTTGEAGPVPPVPVQSTSPGPKKPNENRVVPSVPAVPADRRQATFRRGGFAAALQAVFKERANQTLDADAFEERAAIMEFDGGLSRKEAEHRAAQAQGCKNVIDLMGAGPIAGKGGDTKRPVHAFEHRAPRRAS